MIEVAAATRLRMYCKPGDAYEYADGKQVRTGIIGEVHLHDKGTVGVVEDDQGNEICRVPAGAPLCHTDEGMVIGTGGPAALMVVQTTCAPPN